MLDNHSLQDSLLSPVLIASKVQIQNAGKAFFTDVVEISLSENGQTSSLL